MYEDENALTAAQVNGQVSIGGCSGTFASGSVTIADTWSNCGINPSHDTTANTIVFESSVVAASPVVTHAAASGNDIQLWLTRTQDFTIKCSYPDTADVNTNAHVDVQTLGASGTVEGTGNAWDSLFTFNIMTDDTYQTVKDTATTASTLGDTVYAQLSEGLPDGLDWYTEYCRAAKDDTQGNDYVDLFNQFECAYDIFDVDFENRQPNVATTPYNFNFHSFVFDESGAASDQLYLYCKMKICVAGDTSCTTMQTQALTCDADFTMN